MKNLLKLLITLNLALFGNQVYANKILAGKHACLACHSVDNKILGPAFKDVASRYKGDASAEAKLFAKVKNGGSKVWGPMPMPAMSNVSDEDIKTLVAWILSLGDGASSIPVNSPSRETNSTDNSSNNNSNAQASSQTHESTQVSTTNNDSSANDEPVDGAFTSFKKTNKGKSKKRK